MGQRERGFCKPIRARVRGTACRPRKMCIRDSVMVRFSDDTHTLLYTNVDRGKIYLQDVYGNALPYDVDEIKQWPWELEQKGGSNDLSLIHISISARGATSCPFSTRSSNLSSRAASRSSHARARIGLQNPRSLWPNSSPWDGECLPFRQPSSDYPRNVYDRKCCLLYTSRCV